jgi:hypothetical protein
MRSTRTGCPVCGLASDVAANLAGAYNPFHVFGPSGCGKTRLLMAIAAESRQAAKGAIPSVSIYSKQTPGYIEKTSCPDLLLVDDLEEHLCLSEGEPNLCRHLKHLHERGTQLVLAGRSSTEQLDALFPRATQFLRWGISEELLAPSANGLACILNEEASTVALLEGPPLQARGVSLSVRSGVIQAQLISLPEAIRSRLRPLPLGRSRCGSERGYEAWVGFNSMEEAEAALGSFATLVEI